MEGKYSLDFYSDFTPEEVGEELNNRARRGWLVHSIQCVTFRVGAGDYSVLFERAVVETEATGKLELIHIPGETDPRA